MSTLNQWFAKSGVSPSILLLATCVHISVNARAGWRLPTDPLLVGLAVEAQGLRCHGHVEASA
eukprot:1118864-Amphidinium_carterae.1